MLLSSSHSTTCRCTLMVVTVDGWDGPPTCQVPFPCLHLSTPMPASQSSSEVLLSTFPTTTPGQLPPAQHTLSQTPTVTRSDTSRHSSLFLPPTDGMLTSSWTVVSLRSTYFSRWNAQLTNIAGRNGVQPTAQIAQGNWCNVIGTGFGVRPTTSTGHAYLDAFVWIKPGGEADGTSDTSAVRYDFHCGSADALKPAPEAGTWFQAYFEQLLRNANPTF